MAGLNGGGTVFLISLILKAKQRENKKQEHHQHTDTLGTSQTAQKF